MQECLLPLTQQEINTLANINKYDWAAVEPSIFGTLFERTLDPDKRSQLGAHYTSKEDILTLLEPVVFAPLRREWAAAGHEQIHRSHQGAGLSADDHADAETPGRAE